MQMSAFRPEAFRYTRLASVFRDIERDALAGAFADRWSEALSAMDDSKGDLTITWRSAEDQALFADLADRAWAAHGEAANQIVHLVTALAPPPTPEKFSAFQAKVAPTGVTSSERSRVEFHPPSFGVGLLLGALALVAILGIR
jgi:hypothetical protein